MIVTVGRVNVVDAACESCFEKDAITFLCMLTPNHYRRAVHLTCRPSVRPCNRTVLRCIYAGDIQGAPETCIHKFSKMLI